MPGVDITKEKLTSEQKRNLILRLRFGSYGNQENYCEKEKLAIQGKAVKHKQRTKKVIKFPDYSRVRLISTNKAKLNELNGLLKAWNIYKLNMSPGIVSKKSTLYSNHGNVATTLRCPHLSECGGDDQNENSDVYMGIKISRNGVLEAVQELPECHNASEMSNFASGFDQSGFAKPPKSLQQISTDREKYPNNDQLENSLADSCLKRSSLVNGNPSAFGKLSRKTSLIRRSSKRWTGESDKSRRSQKGSKQEYQNMDEKILYRFHEALQGKKSMTIFFDYPGVLLSHVDVLEAIEEVIPDAFETEKVSFVQFENINIKFQNQNRENRWFIQLKDYITMQKLLETGIRLERPKAKELNVKQNDC